VTIESNCQIGIRAGKTAFPMGADNLAAKDQTSAQYLYLRNDAGVDCFVCFIRIYFYAVNCGTARHG